MRSLLIVAGLLLSGCVPADYLNLFNATGEEITVVMDKSQRAITIAPGAAVDFSPIHLPGERIVIRTAKRSWHYSPDRLFAPPGFAQSHIMVIRAFARIDSRGRIYLLSPPRNRGAPQETAQPSGFPVNPSKT